MLVRKTILLVMWLFTLNSTAYTQYKFDKAVVINKENGLPTNETGPIRKDDAGFIWIGTGDGLCRYDGQFVKLYQANNDLQHSLFDNYIISILPVKNFIWIGTGQGISILNTKTNTFKHYQLDDNKKSDTLKRRFDQHVTALFKDHFGTIWVGTRDRGVCFYDERTDDFHFFSTDRKKYPPLSPALGWDKSILSITESINNDSVIWAGTPGGLQKINRYTGEVKLYSFPQKDKDYQVALNAFRRLYHHDDGLLYTGSWAASVNVFDPVLETFTPLRIQTDIGKKILNATISNLTKKSDHEIWITTGKGLAVYDTKLHEVTWTKFNNSEKNEYYGIDLIDVSNRIWYPFMGGALCYDPVIQQFARYSFSELSSVEWAYAFYILSDKTGNNITLCPRQTDGIYHFDKLRKVWSKTLFPGHEHFNKEIEAIRSFGQLPSGEYVMSSDKGIYLFSEGDKTMKPLHKNLPFSILRKGAIVIDHAGYLWMSRDNKGVVKWKPGTQEFEMYNLNFTSTDSADLPAWFNHFYEDSKHNIWMQTSNGFGVVIASSKKFLTLNYLKNETNGFPPPNSFAEDKNGRVWMCGNDGWLGYALSNDPGRGVVLKINLKQKGIQGSIDQMTTDNEGNVWGYTLKELMKINTKDLSFTTFNFRYGIDEADFYHFSFLPSGEIIFGGRNDIILANPTELKRNREIPVPYIDRMEVLNQPYNFI